MNGVWSFLKDGKPTGAMFAGPAKALAANTPDGCEAVPGVIAEDRHDPEIARARIIASIEEIERKQVRSIADLIENPSDQLARFHFEKRKEQIAQLRASLEKGTSAP